jgi:hypothetical protein
VLSPHTHVFLSKTPSERRPRAILLPSCRRRYPKPFIDCRYIEVYIPGFLTARLLSLSLPPRNAPKVSPPYHTMTAAHAVVESLHAPQAYRSLSTIVLLLRSMCIWMYTVVRFPGPGFPTLADPFLWSFASPLSGTVVYHTVRDLSTVNVTTRGVVVVGLQICPSIQVRIFSSSEDDRCRRVGKPILLATYP